MFQWADGVENVEARGVRPWGVLSQDCTFSWRGAIVDTDHVFISIFNSLMDFYSYFLKLSEAILSFFSPLNILWQWVPWFAYAFYKNFLLFVQLLQLLATGTLVLTLWMTFSMPYMTSYGTVTNLTTSVSCCILPYDGGPEWFLKWGGSMEITKAIYLLQNLFISSIVSLELHELAGLSSGVTNWLSSCVFVNGNS